MTEYITATGDVAAAISLKPNEHIACRNATIIVDDEDNFSGWIDNACGVVVAGNNDTKIQGGQGNEV